MGLWQKFKKNKEDNNKPVAKKHVPPSAHKVVLAENKIKYLIAIASGKGGVGKSTVSNRLAFALQQQGKQVGLLDADIYGPSQALMLQDNQQAKVIDGLIQPIESQDLKYISMSAVAQKSGPLIARSPIAVKAIQQLLYNVAWGELDYLIIDLPPGTGDIQLSLAQKAHLSGVIIVTTPQNLAVDIAEKSLQMFQRVNVPILGIIENMSGFTCQHCHTKSNIFSDGGGQQLAQKYKIPLLGKLPLVPEVMFSSDERTIQPSSKDITLLDTIMLDAAQKMSQVLKENESGTAFEPSKFSFDKLNRSLELEWSDGARLSITPYELRRQCGCALCRDEVTGEQLLVEEKIPTNITLLEAKPMGRYGLACRFSDGHKTGIYRYQLLKEQALKG